MLNLTDSESSSSHQEKNKKVEMVNIEKANSDATVNPEPMEKALQPKAAQRPPQVPVKIDLGQVIQFYKTKK